VAIDALSVVVICRRIAGVARLAIDKATVAEGNSGPGVGAGVAVGALATVIVICRHVAGVARLAIDNTVVGKCDVAPGVGAGVTVRTLAVVMACR